MTFWIPPAAVGGRFRSCLLTRPGLESASVERERTGTFLRCRPTMKKSTRCRGWDSAVSASDPLWLLLVPFAKFVISLIFESLLF